MSKYMCIYLFSTKAVWGKCIAKFKSKEGNNPCTTIDSGGLAPNVRERALSSLYKPEAKERGITGGNGDWKFSEKQPTSGSLKQIGSPEHMWKKKIPTHTK